MSTSIEEPDHDVALIIGGNRIEGWERYEIGVDLLQPSDHFSFTLPFSREAWDLVREDSPVRVTIDDAPFIDGFTDERLVPEDGEVLEVIGRDRIGRLVQESAPSLQFAGLKLNDLVAELAKPWFTVVTNSNELNRRVMRGRGKKAKAAGENVRLFSAKKLDSRIQPGQTKWTVIQNLVTQAGLIACSSGDGKTLWIGKPNYDQEVQFRFFMPAADSARTDESTVLGMGVKRSTADRYSKVVVVGNGTGTDAHYGPTVSSLYGEAKDDPNTRDGDGRDFSAPKRLIVVRTVNSKAEADELAAREMARRDTQGDTITVRAAGHGQVIAGREPTLFVPDTLASVEDERTGTKGIYLIVSCVYRGERQGGKQTVMELVRKGSELTAA